MDAWEKLGYVSVVAVLLLALITLSIVIFSDSKIDYCKIIWNKDANNGYQLVAHRPWIPNETMASNLSSFEDAVEKANQISCEIR